MGDLAWRALALPEGVVVEDLFAPSFGPVIVSGLRDGVAYAVACSPDGEQQELAIPSDVAARGSARLVRSSDFGVMGVCGSTGLWGRSLDDYWLGKWHGPRAFEVPLSEEGHKAVWLWVTEADGELQATAAYPVHDGHELRPLDIDTQALMPVEQRLVTSAPLGSLHVAAFAGRVTVAGPITDPAKPEVWWSRSRVLDPDQFRVDPVPWLSTEFDGSPIQILGAGALDGAMSFFLGVTRNGTAALWDATGELREQTDMSVDLSDPLAFIADMRGWGDWGESDGPGGLATLAVSTPAGNRLLHRGETYEIPAGRMRQVQVEVFTGLRCVALVDDVVYVCDLEWEDI